MDDPEEILRGKCIVCFARGNLQHYAGRFAWLNASVCAPCAAQQAEPLSLVLLWISANGGPEACADVARAWVTYLSPGYVGWDDIRALYAEQIHDMLSVIESELGPDYADAIRNGRPSSSH